MEFNGPIGKYFSQLNSIEEDCICKLESIKLNALDSVKKWKKEYEASLKKKKTNDTTLVSNGETSLVPESGRPARNARNKAIENIRKQTLLPLNKKLRRPDEPGEKEKTSKSIRNKIPSSPEIFVTQNETKKSLVQREVKNDEEEHFEDSEKVEENNLQTRSKSRSTEIILTGPSPAISPVPFSPEHVQVINESVEDATETFPVKVSDVNNSQKKRKKTSRVDIFCDKVEEQGILEKTLVLKDQSKGNVTFSEVDSIIDDGELRKTGKSKRKKARKGKKTISHLETDFNPCAESSCLVEDLEKTRNLTPKNVNNATFLLTAPEFFGSGPKTVLRVNEKNSTFVCEDENDGNSYEVVNESFQKPMETTFQKPLPVASKRTKPVVKSKFYDAMGNLLIPEPVSSKPANADSSECHETGSGDVGRPVRTRTKVRRFGVDEGEVEPSQTNTSQVPASRDIPMDTLRVLGMKAKAPHKTSDGVPSKIAKAITQQSKAKRASLVFQQQQNQIKLLASMEKRLKTPLSTLTNLNVGSKKKARPDEYAKLYIKPSEDVISEEREARLKAKQEKEELAAWKKNEALARKRELLKLKNEEKLQRAQRCRVKMEEERYEQIVQTEKEKELKRQQVLQEREEKQKAELTKKKMITEKKLADHEERRRLEEEARLAKIREMELEQQRQQQEKQRQLEYEEKRAKERLEEKKKINEAEKLEKKRIAEAKAEAEKAEKIKMAYAAKYRARGKEDLGLEDENSEESDAEEQETPKKSLPTWVKDIKKGKPIWKYITPDQIAMFMPIKSKSPNVQQMFNMTPKRQITRNSSAIWNDSMSTPK